MNPRQLERVETEYRIYKIVAADFRGRAEAFAFAGARKIDNLTADNVEAAEGAMRARLDERLARFKEQRANGVPSVEEFTDALNVVFANGQARLEHSLVTHCKFRGAASTFSYIASRSDLSAEQIERDYLRFGRWLNSKMEMEAKRPDGVSPKYQPVAIFALFEEADSEAEQKLMLRPELVAALNGLRKT